MIFTITGSFMLALAAYLWHRRRRREKAAKADFEDAAEKSYRELHDAKGKGSFEEFELAPSGDEQLFKQVNDAMRDWFESIAKHQGTDTARTRLTTWIKNLKASIA